MFEVLESTRFVARESRSVRIDEKALFAFAGRLVKEDVRPLPWDRAHHFTGPPEQVTAYVLVLDTINFCFWSPEENQTWETDIGGRAVSGYNGLAAALKRALENGVPLTDAGFLAGLSERDLERVLQGRGRLQLMEERALAIRELGAVLLRNYNGKAHRLVEATRGWAGDLARLLAKKLVSFRDTAVYRERAVYFYKRGQILAADLHGALQGRGWGAFRDMHRLTAFADYKLPQVLRHIGVLVYGKGLALRVDRQEPLEAGSPEEVEIRANTIVAVEMIREAAAEMGRRLRSFEIDGILWQMGQEEEYRSHPYHRTLSVFY
ncbi:MAG: queuosine salvage family protein [Desulfatiglandales bacterium]